MRKLLVSLGLVVFLLSGCANGPAQKAATPGDALPTLLAAIQKTNDAGSGRMAMDLTFTSPKQTCTSPAMPSTSRIRATPAPSANTSSSTSRRSA